MSINHVFALCHKKNVWKAFGDGRNRVEEGSRRLLVNVDTVEVLRAVDHPEQTLDQSSAPVNHDRISQWESALLFAHPSLHKVTGSDVALTEKRLRKNGFNIE